MRIVHADRLASVFAESTSSCRGLALFILFASTLWFTMAWQSSAFPQDGTFPNRAITVILPYPAGGVVEGALRTVTEKLARRLGKPVVVINTPGAGGMIGWRAAARAPADGYTLTLITKTLLTNPLTMKDPGVIFEKDLVAVADMFSLNLLIISNPSFNAKDVNELIARAKEAPGTVKWGYSIGIHELLMMNVERQGGVSFLQVPYKGSSETLVGVLGGTVDIGTSAISTATQLIETGKLNALAYSGPTRAKGLPAVPALAETYPDLVIGTWNGIGAPAGTPKAIVDRLAKEIGEILSDSEVRGHIESLGFDISQDTTPERATSMILKDKERNETLYRSLGIKPQ